MNFLEFPFMRTALMASLLAGNATALIGGFVLMRRVGFSGLAVSQLAALGAVVGLLIGHAAFFGVALAFVLAGLIGLGMAAKSVRIPQEAWVACLYVFGASLSVLILSKAPLGELQTLSIFFGNVLALGRKEVLEGLILLLVTLPVLGVWFHRWVWMSFDPQSAEIAGIRLRWWDAGFYALFAVVMVFGIHLFGVLLAFSYLLLPAAASLFLSRRLFRFFLAIPVVASLATVAGFLLSFHFDLPTGPLISALLALATVASAILRRIRRGSLL